MTVTVENPIQMRPLDETERCDMNDQREMGSIPTQADNETNTRPSEPVTSRAHPAEKIVDTKPTSASQHCPLDAAVPDFYPTRGSTNELWQHHVTALENTATRIDEPEEPAKKHTR